jgi:hypothetical protein
MKIGRSANIERTPPQNDRLDVRYLLDRETVPGFMIASPFGFQSAINILPSGTGRKQVKSNATACPNAATIVKSGYCAGHSG